MLAQSPRTRARKARLARWQRVSSLLALVVILTGCEVSNSFFSNPNERSELDAELTALLEEAGGMSNFVLPASNDFSNIPQDPNNPLSAAKVELGKFLFHETGLLVNNLRDEGVGSSSCAACHHAAAGFQAGVVQAIGEGGSGFGVRGEGRIKHIDYEDLELDVQPIRSPTAMHGAYQDVNLWNGQFGGTGTNLGTEASWVGFPRETNHLGFEGLETQAIAALKVHRMESIEETIAKASGQYRVLFAKAFPGQDINRVNAGLAIGAYERTLLANAAPWQKWLRGRKGAMNDQEKRGAILFFDKAACADCHTGPALTSMTFYALGMDDLDTNNPGVYGNIPVDDGESLGRAGFTGDPADNFKFKTPQLYNLIDSPFFGHGGSFNTVRDVIEYKNAAVPARAVATSQLAAQFVPLGLSDAEIDDLTAFVENALYDADLFRYVPDALPSGNCFPVNDAQARLDLGCD